MSRFPNLKLKLNRADANGPDLMQRALRVMQNAGVKQEDIDSFQKEALSGGEAGLLSVIHEYFDVD